MIKEAGHQFGELAKLFLLDEYFVPAMIDMDGLDPDAPAGGDLTIGETMRRNTIYVESKNRTTHMAKMRSDRPKLYCFMVKTLSKASEEAVKQRPNWNAIRTEQDPLLLYRAIRDSHVIQSCGDETADKQMARDNFATLKLDGGNLDDFMQDFQFAVEMLEATDQNGLYNDEALMSEFVSKLDGRFAQFKADLDNQALAGTPRPATYTVAYNRAMRYKVVGNRDGKGYSNNTTMVAASDIETDRLGRGDSGGRRGGRGRGGRSERGGRGGRGNGENRKRDRETSVEAGGDPKKKKKKCFYCQEPGHFVPDCPHISRASLAGASEKHSNSSDRNGSGSSSSSEGFNLMSAVSVVDQNDRLAAIGLFDSLDPYDAFLDSGCNNTIWRNMAMCTNVYDDPRPYSTKGINGSFVPNLRGTLPGFFDVSGSEEALWNILSLSECEDRFDRIDYKKGQYYRVWVEPDYYIEFRRRYGVFIGNLREYLT
jgi:hypothetical protein